MVGGLTLPISRFWSGRSCRPQFAPGRRELISRCECRGHLARSILQTQFFRHYNGESDCVYATSSESAEHIFAKEEIAAGARAAGASATVERSSPRDAVSRWRADVVVAFGTERFAFEVQVSAQPTDEYLRRHRRYTGDRVDAVWFVSGDQAGAQRLAGLAPAFQLEFGFDSATVTGLGELSRGEMELRDFAGLWVIGWRPARPGFRTAEYPPEPVELEAAGDVPPAPDREHVRPLEWVDSRPPLIWRKGPAQMGASIYSRGARYSAHGCAWSAGGLIRSSRGREVSRASRGGPTLHSQGFECGV